VLDTVEWKSVSGNRIGRKKAEVECYSGTEPQATIIFDFEAQSMYLFRSSRKKFNRKKKLPFHRGVALGKTQRSNERSAISAVQSHRILANPGYNLQKGQKHIHVGPQNKCQRH
jgi:hypothetical protein